MLRHVPREERWLETHPRRLHRVPATARHWIAWPHSLTERVAAHVGNSVRIRVLSERDERLLRDERDLLEIVERSGRVREVQLEVNGHPYVVARTVYPRSTARGTNDGLRRLGSRSLGSLLFGALRAPAVTREFATLNPHAPLWRMMQAHLPREAAILWARRAVHSLRGRPLLVTEIFLPRLFEDRLFEDSHGSPTR